MVQKDDESLEVATYAKAFPQEVDEIAFELDKFITKLSVLEDEVYNKKEAYISYLTAIKNAFLEENIDEVVGKWRIAEKLWMEIDTPFQIGHPMEFYEDNYRKAVAPEWDLRIVDTSLLESKVETDMRNMYEHFYDDIGRCKYEDSYKYSLDNMNRVQQYISAPVLYFGAEFTGLFSAQVVPNDEVVSQAHGKKIFAF
ncbi:MAG: CiaB protein, partial [Patescibacteria group bacterium]